LMTAADFKKMNAKKKFDIVKLVPKEIQDGILAAAGLSQEAIQDADAIVKNTDALAVHLFEFMKNARLAWVEAAVNEDKTKNQIVPEAATKISMNDLRLHYTWETAGKMMQAALDFNDEPVQNPDLKTFVKFFEFVSKDNAKALKIPSTAELGNMKKLPDNSKLLLDFAYTHYVTVFKAWTISDEK
jgi:hypothetical protein